MHHDVRTRILKINKEKVRTRILKINKEKVRTSILKINKEINKKGDGAAVSVVKKGTGLRGNWHRSLSDLNYGRFWQQPCYPPPRPVFHAGL